MSASSSTPYVDKYAPVLDAHRISRIEFAILRAVAFGPFPLNGFETRLADLWSNILPFPAPPRRLLSREVTRCIENRLIRVVNDTVVREIQSSLAAKGYSTPLYGWPEDGTLDFTTRGASLYSSVWRSLATDSQSQDFESLLNTTESWYFASEERAKKELTAVVAEGEAVVLQTAISIGRWRVRWWNHYEHGFRADVFLRDSKGA